MQCDEDLDGVGDACEFFDTFFQVDLRDTDGDGVADVLDNCIFVSNPAQADTGGVTDEGATDLIGDACPEQVATVNVAGDISLELAAQLVLTQGQDQVSYLTVEFDHADLDCDWEFGACTVPASAIEICVNTTLAAASVGCP
jgi:hypothetical protein